MNVLGGGIIPDEYIRNTEDTESNTIQDDR
jgi:hypothetical protein